MLTSMFIPIGILGSQHSLVATDSGAKPATSGADNASVGTKAWTAYFGTGDGSTVDLLPAAVSQYGFFKGFDFSAMPTGAQITGLEAGFLVNTLNDLSVQVNAVRLFLAGTPTGNTKLAATPVASGVDVPITAGGVGDLWGLTPTVSDLQNANFGVGISFVSIAGRGTVSVRVNHPPTIKVYYSV